MTAAASLPAQEKTPPVKEGAPTTVVPTAELQTLLSVVQELQVRHQYFDALQKLDQAEALSPDNYVFQNVRGSIYTGMRDFDRARECFEQALKLMPGAFEPRFNLAELLFVQGKYAEAEDAFSRMLKEVPRLREEVRHLTQLLVMVCRLKQNHMAEAEEAAKNFTFMDDTPAYYFAKAATAFQKGNKEEAQSWEGKAQRIFKEAQNSPYFDTMIEAHWMESILVPSKKVEKSAGDKAPEETKPAPEAKP